MQLITEIIHPELKSTQGRVFRRHAARGIVLRDEQILLLFTERYNDFRGINPRGFSTCLRTLMTPRG